MRKAQLTEGQTSLGK